MIKGYAAGVFDLFHVGHVRLLRRAKQQCDHLTVAVSTDEVVRYKSKVPVIPFEERMEVVASCRYVDSVVPQESLDKIEAWRIHQFDILFVGTDWKGSKRWKEYEEFLSKNGSRVIYLPYTKGTSSTLINSTLDNLRSS